METLYTGMFETLAPEAKLVKPFPRLSYEEAMQRFGSDKPDLRFGIELADFSDALRESEFTIFRQTIASGGVVRGLCVPNGAAFSRKQVDDLTTFVQQYGAKGLVSMAFLGEGGMDSLTQEDIRSPVAKYFTPEQAKEMARIAGAKRGDMLLMVADRPAAANKALDALRRELGRALELIDPNVRHFAFVTDFPLFEWNDDDERWYSVTHPFTAPRPEEEHLLDSDPGGCPQPFVRPRLQRLGGRRRQHSHPRPRDAGAHVLDPRHHAGRSAGQVRAHAGGVRVRRAAARRHGDGHRPQRGAPRGR